MIDRSAAEQVSEALVRAYNHWDRGHRTETADSTQPNAHNGPPTVAISRQTGALGNTVARAVAERLGWVVYDHELLEQIAKRMDVRVDLLESVDERHVGWLEEQVEAFASVPYVNEHMFFRHLVQTILSLGSHGNCLILGRGSTFILPARHTLRVRLVASVEDRISVMSSEFGISRHEAMRLVRDTDRARAAFIKEHFHQDVADPMHYDLVLNSSRLKIEQCADLIVTALTRFQRSAPPGLAREDAVLTA